MIDQTTKDKLIADARIIFDEVSALSVDAGPATSEVQALLDAANATIANQRSALADKQAENDALVIRNAQVQSIVDIVRAAVN